MININFRDARPIYEQVRDGFRQLILTGALPADSRLPSVRELAGQLAINPNTIQRAYRELEQGGYIDSVPGKGNFAALSPEAAAKRRRELAERLRQTASELRALGATEAELRTWVSEGGEKA
jgi:GntR family transcriptional regulator